MDAAARDGFQMTDLQKLENKRFTDENADPLGYEFQTNFCGLSNSSH
jgi:hypothetical protein